MGDKAILYDPLNNDESWIDDDDEEVQVEDDEAALVDSDAAQKLNQVEKSQQPREAPIVITIAPSDNKHQATPRSSEQEEFMFDEGDVIGKVLDEVMNSRQQIPWYDKTNAINSREEALGQGLLYRKNADISAFTGGLSRTQLQLAVFLLLVSTATVFIFWIRKSRRWNSTVPSSLPIHSRGQAYGKQS